tara:strand:- start:1498 stop:1977 length:480 start_codon:yes stop_codon:yes gene_type:complete
MTNTNETKNLGSPPPGATLIITDFGHAYTKAKYKSVCRLTGMEIQYGDPIRRIIVNTGDGDREVYTSNKIAGHLRLQSQDAGMTSRVHRCTHDWVARVAAYMEAAPIDTCLLLVDKTGKESKYKKAWGGKWQGRSRNTPKQLIAILNRSRSFRLFSWTH